MFDLEEPILHQLWSETYSKDEYFNWIHKPITTNIRIFGSNYLEMLTNTPWYIIPIVWIPYVFSIWLQFAPNMNFYAFLAFVLTGFSIWPLFEYTFHRFLFHMDETFIPSYNICYCAHFLLHGLHHLCPQDKFRLVMPVVLFWSLMTMTRLGLFKLLPISEPTGWILTSGIIIGYMYYDLIHYYLHNGSRYYRKLRSHHYSHHFKTENLKFGVSSSWMDKIVGTL
jgi:4-hydroxysphinganine ceramide fatty acyl 2-hydroxylase